MSWSEKYKKSIDCDNPKGFSQKAHCQGRKRKMNESSKENLKFSKFSHVTKHFKKSEHQLDPNIDLKHLVHHSVKQYIDRDADGDVDIFDNLKKGIPDENVQSASTAQSASDKLIAKQKGELKHTRRGMAYEETTSGDEGLHDWFNKSKSSDGKSGWVQLGGKWAGKPCARQPGQKSTPKCGSSKMASNLSDEGEEKARRRKNRQDPNQPEKSGGAKPTYVRTEEMDLQEVKDKPGKGSGKKDACYHKVKSRYDVWPSAYASGALVKCRKVGASNWGTKKEETNIDELFLLTPRKKRKKRGDDDRYRSPDSSRERARKIIDAQIKRQDAERAELRRQHAMSEERGQVRYCPRCKKDETRSECKYGGSFWDMFSTPTALTTNQLKFDIAQVHPTNEEKDHEHSMARAEISKIISAAKRLRGKVKGEGNLPAWVQSKITRAADYIDTAADYADSGEMNESVHYIVEALNKAKMKCNSPKAQAHGSGEQGKSHVVKACEGGKENIIRFGQVGVKGSPKKKESLKNIEVVEKDLRQDMQRILLKAKCLQHIGPIKLSGE